MSKSFCIRLPDDIYEYLVAKSGDKGISKYIVEILASEMRHDTEFVESQYDQRLESLLKQIESANESGETGQNTQNESESWLYRAKQEQDIQKAVEYALVAYRGGIGLKRLRDELNSEVYNKLRDAVRRYGL